MTNTSTPDTSPTGKVHITRTPVGDRSLDDLQAMAFQEPMWFEAPDGDLVIFIQFVRRRLSLKHWNHQDHSLFIASSFAELATFMQDKRGWGSCSTRMSELRSETGSALSPPSIWIPFLQKETENRSALSTARAEIGGDLHVASHQSRRPGRWPLLGIHLSASVGECANHRRLVLDLPRCQRSWDTDWASEPSLSRAADRGCAPTLRIGLRRVPVAPHRL